VGSADALGRPELVITIWAPLAPAFRPASRLCAPRSRFGAHVAPVLGSGHRAASRPIRPSRSLVGILDGSRATVFPRSVTPPAERRRGWSPPTQNPAVCASGPALARETELAKRKNFAGSRARVSPRPQAPFNARRLLRRRGGRPGVEGQRPSILRAPPSTSRPDNLDEAGVGECVVPGDHLGPFHAPGLRWPRMKTDACRAGPGWWQTRGGGPAPSPARGTLVGRMREAARPGSAGRSRSAGEDHVSLTQSEATPPPPPRVAPKRTSASPVWRRGPPGVLGKVAARCPHAPMAPPDAPGPLKPAVGPNYPLAAPMRGRRYLIRKDTAMPYRKLNHIHP